MERTKLSPPENRLLLTAKSVAVVVADPAPVQAPSRVGLLLALVLLGGGLRLAALVSDRCLWIDEAMLALNLVDRTPRQLFDKLDYNQGAPVGFLLAAKASISTFGVSAWALRLVPFLASVAGLVGFAFVARRLLPGAGAVLALGLFAVSPHLISYAGECKQYASDAALAVGLLAVAMGLLCSVPSPLAGEDGSRSVPGEGALSDADTAEHQASAKGHPSPGRRSAGHPLPQGERAETLCFRRYAALAVAGAGAVWCSHPAVFVLGGIGTALLARGVVGRDRAKFLAAGGTVAVWLVSFAACYLVCLKQLGGNKYLTDYWAGHFMALPPKGPGDLAWLVDHVVAFFTTPGGFGGTAIPFGGGAALLALIGLREFARERWPVAVALAVPAVLVLLASGLHKYPIGGRLMLFMVPFAVLLVARGGWAVFEALSTRNRFAARALLVLLVAAPLWDATEYLRKPPRSEQLAPVLEHVRSEFRPGDRVFVYYGAVPAFNFYTRLNPFPTEAVTLGDEHRADPAAYRAELTNLRGRVWVVVSHRHSDEEAQMLAVLDTRGTREAEVNRPGAAAYLYRLE